MTKQDKAKMEKANPYPKLQPNGNPERTYFYWSEGYAAAVGDRDEPGRDDEITVERDGLKAENEGLIYGNVWLRHDIDGLKTHLDSTRDEVDRLREAIKEVKFPTQKMIEALTPQGADTPNAETLKAIADGPEPGTYETADALIRDMLEDTPADTPCKECGKVGGGGHMEYDEVQPGSEEIRQIREPCPRCGTTDTPTDAKA